jgi:hypothetical protein
MLDARGTFTIAEARNLYRGDRTFHSVWASLRNHKRITRVHDSSVRLWKVNPFWNAPDYEI